MKMNLTLHIKLKAAIHGVWKQSYEVKEDEIGRAHSTCGIRTACSDLVIKLEGK
jgi:hypothetical protein